jgi:hypothetical protein
MCVSEEESTSGEEAVVAGCLIGNVMTTFWWSLRFVHGHAQHLMGARLLHDTQIQPWPSSEVEQRLHM